MCLFDGFLRLGLRARLVGLVLLVPFAGSLLDGNLSSNNVLGGLQDGTPVREGGEGYILTHTVGDKV